MPADVISKVAGALRDVALSDMATAVAPIESLREFLDPNCVKALRAADGRALYFSRAPVPWPRDSVVDHEPTAFAGAWRHVGIYAYRVRSLLQLPRGRRRRSRRRRSSSSCALWSTACTSIW